MARNPDAARTRMLWAANKPGESAAPAYRPDPPLWWHVSLALAIALLVQSALAPYLALRGATPSFVLLVVAWYAMRTDWLAGLVFGAIAGACEDAFAGSTGVAWTFATALAGAAVGRFAFTWLTDTKPALVPAAALVTVLRFATFACIMQFEGRPIPFAALHFHVALWQSLLDAIIALVALTLFPALGGFGAHRR